MVVFLYHYFQSSHGMFGWVDVQIVGQIYVMMNISVNNYTIAIQNMHILSYRLL